MIDSAEATDAEKAKLEDLTLRLTEAEAVVSSTRAFLAQLDVFDAADLDNSQLPDVITSSEIVTLRTSLAEVNRAIVARSADLGENHPQYLALLAQRETLEQQISDEVTVLKGRLEARLSGSVAQIANLQDQLQAQRSRLLGLQRNRNELDTLRREVQVRQEEYDQAFSRAGVSRQQGELVLSSVQVLAPAVPPVSHSFPKRTLSMILSILGGGVMGVGLALLTEMIDRRVRGTVDLETIVSAPVLTLIPRAKPFSKGASGQSKRTNRKDQDTSGLDPLAAE